MDNMTSPQALLMKKRSVHTTLHHLLSGLVRSLAPILPHLTEEVWHYQYKEGGCIVTCNSNFSELFCLEFGLKLGFHDFVKVHNSLF